MSSYYAILHDGDPGPSHFDNILSKEHVGFTVDAHLYPDRVVVQPWRKLEFEARRALRGDPMVTVWDGPTYLYTFPVGMLASNVAQGDIVSVEIGWTQSVERSEMQPTHKRWSPWGLFK